MILILKAFSFFVNEFPILNCDEFSFVDNVLPCQQLSYRYLFQWTSVYVKVHLHQFYGWGIWEWQTDTANV